MELVSKNKITVVGSGYVGMSLSVLLAQNNDVTVLDIDPVRIEMINNNQSTVADPKIELFLAQKSLSLSATMDKESAYQDASFIIIATPTNYDPLTNSFDTSSVDRVVDDALKLNKDALVVIKSTIPIGHTSLLREKFGTNRVIFSPEFLREGQALQDNLYPSRIIMGSKSKAAKEFARLLKRGAKKVDIETLFIGSNEAEAVKLFSNTYLAMRVAYFNELDSYCEKNKLDTKEIIDGVSLDSRIASHYNNPSFGYGGYCLPKDTKQLLANFENTPNKLIKAIVEANSTRKDYIADNIISKKPKVVGVYKLAMKQGSDNFRESAIHDIIQKIKEKNIDIVLFEPSIKEGTYMSMVIEKNLDSFKRKSDLIITNRLNEEILDVREKVYTRDIYNDN